MSTYLFAEDKDVAFLIEETADGIYLFTLRPDAFIGDTWHPTIDEAKAQAAYDLGAIVGPWRSIAAALGDRLKTGKTCP